MLRDLPDGEYTITVTAQTEVPNANGGTELYTNQATVQFRVDSTSFSSNLPIFVIPAVVTAIVLIVIVYFYREKNLDSLESKL